MRRGSDIISIETARRARLSDALIRAGQGHRPSFEYVYQQTSAKLFGVCLRIFPDRQEAEEALQDAYLTIWTKASSFESGETSPISWLVTVTRNRAIDRLRASGRVGYVPIEQAPDIVDPSPLADASLEMQADAQALKGCLDGLDKRDSHFITSAFIRGSTYAQLAASEGEPLGTVKSRIRRALMKLRHCLEGKI